MFTMLWVAAGLVIFFALVVLLARAQRKDAPLPASAANDLPPEVAALDDAAFHARLQQEIAAGRAITAIKWLRMRTGLGLKEAKDVVDSLIPGAIEHRVEELRGLDDVDFQARLLVELAAGRKIEAIKLYRERTGLGLKEAKDAIDALERGG